MPIAPRLLTLVLAAALAGSSTVPVSAQALRIALQDDPDRLDPAQGGTFVGRIVFAALCDKLIDIDAKLDFRPQLATQWDWSQDGKALVMKIRSGVVFHDGTPLDSEAVKINIDRYRTADYSRRKSEVKSIANVVVVDPLTIRIELSEPDAPLLSVLADRAGMMLSPKASPLSDRTSPVSRSALVPSVLSSGSRSKRLRCSGLRIIGTRLAST